MHTTYPARVRALLSPAERGVFEKLRTPVLIQNYLEALPQNFSFKAGETCRSPRRILKDRQSRKAYCFEGALLAAAALAYHGFPPLLLDIQTIDDDQDHIVTLFKERGRWGAISKTNNPVLRWRDPVYTSVRELAMSYFHEYFLYKDGRKTMRAYSKPFDISKVSPEKWVVAEESLDWLAEQLDDSPHYPVAPAAAIKNLRNASVLERKVLDLEDWQKPKRS